MPAWEVVMLLERLKILVRFFMVSEVHCIIGIPNLFNLSLKGLLYMLVGKEIGSSLYYTLRINHHS